MMAYNSCMVNFTNVVIFNILKNFLRRDMVKHALLTFCYYLTHKLFNPRRDVARAPRQCPALRIANPFSYTHSTDQLHERHSQTQWRTT